MTAADSILVRVLAASDALLLPVRSVSDWGRACSNRYTRSKAGGIPLRAAAGSHPGEGARKSTERQLEDLAGAGLLTVGRSNRVKFPLAKLTNRGEAIARALVGVPGRLDGRALLVEAAAKEVEFVESPEGINGGRWVPETEFNGGRGWGREATAEDRQALAELEVRFLPAGAAGWMVAHSTTSNHVAYTITPGGRRELRHSTADDYAAFLRAWRLPAYDQAALDLYAEERDARLLSLATDPPTVNELGGIPLAPHQFAKVQCDSGSDSG